MIEPQGTEARETQEAIASPVLPFTSPSRMIIVAGVAGTGKTTLGLALARKLGIDFLDADDFHTPEAKAKMARGEPLNDADRQPWLHTLNQGLVARLKAAQVKSQVTSSDPQANPATPPALILACSALKRTYRQTLAEGLNPPPLWFWLEAPRAEIARRLSQRQGHFFDPSLLDSQFLAAEADPQVDLDLFFLNADQSFASLENQALAFLRQR
jgi:carbohydrate kinase (thermoresistant glucokinase family)